MSETQDCKERAIWIIVVPSGVQVLREHWSRVITLHFRRRVEGPAWVLLDLEEASTCDVFPDRRVLVSFKIIVDEWVPKTAGGVPSTSPCWRRWEDIGFDRVQNREHRRRARWIFLFVYASEFSIPCLFPERERSMGELLELGHC